MNRTITSEIFRNYGNPIIRTIRLFCVLCLFFIPAAVSLDYLIYPQLMDSFIVLRLICEVGVLITLKITYSNISQRCLFFPVSLLGLTLSCMICCMIYLSEGASSPYYAVLIVILIGIGGIIPLSVYKTGIFFIVVIALYIISCILSQHNIEWSVFYQNIFFMLISIIICIGARYLGKLSLDHNKNDRNDSKSNSSSLLCAGIVHEINNPLNFMAIYTKALSNKTEDIEYRRMLDGINEGITRIKEISLSLGQIAGSSNEKVSSFTLHETVEKSMLLVSDKVKNIQVKTDIDKNLKVIGSMIDISVIFVNLLINSADATAEIKETREPKIEISAYKKGKRIVVSFKDNGKGIPTYNTDKIFEPFFTTKPNGHGTGLGLSICKDIIKDYRGKLKVKTENNRYTEFIFDLPGDF